MERTISFLVRIMSVGGGGQDGCSPTRLGRNLFHSCKLSERTLGNSVRNFTENVQPPNFDVILRPFRECARNSLKMNSVFHEVKSLAPLYFSVGARALRLEKKQKSFISSQYSKEEISLPPDIRQ